MAASSWPPSPTARVPTDEQMEEKTVATTGMEEEDRGGDNGNSTTSASTTTTSTSTSAASAGCRPDLDEHEIHFPMLSDECIAAFEGREEEHMPMEGYHQRLQPRPEGLDLAAVRKDALDWIWEVIEHYNFAPLTAVLSVNFLDGCLSENEIPLLAVACLSLAAKMEETFVPLLLDLQVAEAKPMFEARNIKRVELLLLSTLKWRLQAVTA